MIRGSVVHRLTSHLRRTSVSLLDHLWLFHRQVWQLQLLLCRRTLRNLATTRLRQGILAMDTLRRAIHMLCRQYMRSRCHFPCRRLVR